MSNSIASNSPESTKPRSNRLSIFGRFCYAACDIFRVSRYLLAIVLPPVAILLCGKPFQAVLNLIPTLCFWIPGVVHALFVVNSHLADVRAEKMIAAVKQKTMRFIKE